MFNSGSQVKLSSLADFWVNNIKNQIKCIIKTGVAIQLHVSLSLIVTQDNQRICHYFYKVSKGSLILCNLTVVSRIQRDSGTAALTFHCLTHSEGTHKDLLSQVTP